MSTTVTVPRPQTTVPQLGRQLLQLVLVLDALTFLTSAAMNFGASIPLGFVTLQFPVHVIPAGVGESIIGAALLLGGVSMRRSWAWLGLWLSVGGIAFGLVATARSGGPAFAVHVVMFALAAVLLGLILWTGREANARMPQNEVVARQLGAGVKASGCLMLVAGLTLLGASAIHFGLTAPLISDSFAAAAIPEAVLGAIMLVGAAVGVSARVGTWELALAATILTILLTIYGFTVTLRRGGIGDIAYHISLLAMLFTSLGLLLSQVGRSNRLAPSRQLP